MKEFEKWFNETYPLPSTIERGPIGRDLKDGCKQAWRAILKLVLTTFKYNLATPDEDSDERVDVYKMIEEELEE